jgi:hypothetical protein
MAISQAGTNVEGSWMNEDFYVTGAEAFEITNISLAHYSGRRLCPMKTIEIIIYL